MGLGGGSNVERHRSPCSADARSSNRAEDSWYQAIRLRKGDHRR